MCLRRHVHTCISVCRDVLIRLRWGWWGWGYCILNPKAKHAHLEDLRVPCYDWQAPFHWRGRMGDGLGLSRPKGPLWLHVSQLLHHAPLSTTKKGLLWVPLCIKLTWCAWHGVVWPSILISDLLKKLHFIGKNENYLFKNKNLDIF